MTNDEMIDIMLTMTLREAALMEGLKYCAEMQQKFWEKMIEKYRKVKS